MYSRDENVKQQHPKLGRFILNGPRQTTIEKCSNLLVRGSCRGQQGCRQRVTLNERKSDLGNLRAVSLCCILGKITLLI